MLAFSSLRSLSMTATTSKADTTAQDSLQGIAGPEAGLHTDHRVAGQSHERLVLQTELAVEQRARTFSPDPPVWWAGSSVP